MAISATHNTNRCKKWSIQLWNPLRPTFLIELGVHFHDNTPIYSIPCQCLKVYSLKASFTQCCCSSESFLFHCLIFLFVRIFYYGLFVCFSIIFYISWNYTKIIPWHFWLCSVVYMSSYKPHWPLIHELEDVIRSELDVVHHVELQDSVVTVYMSVWDAAGVHHCLLLVTEGSVWNSVCALVHRSPRYGSTHDVHYSVPADRQSGPGGLEATELGLQLVLHVRPLMSCFLLSRFNKH